MSRARSPSQEVIDLTASPRRRSPGPRREVIDLTASPSPRGHGLGRQSLRPGDWGPMLAQTLKDARLPPGDWTVSEKLDGVRAMWDGEGALWTRGKNRVNAPAWFLARLPRGLVLDGELFAGRGRFARAASAWVSGWGRDDGVRYAVFDAPLSGKPYEETVESLARALPYCDAPGDAVACLVRTRRAAGYANAKRYMNEVVAAGGEGVMLRKSHSLYAGRRTADLLKLKREHDREAVVVRHEPGRGQHEGAMGALVCRWLSGGAATFKVGTGFSADQRRRATALFPPGTEITVKYMELTERGLPRHPVFKGVRRDLGPRRSPTPHRRSPTRTQHRSPTPHRRSPSPGRGGCPPGLEPKYASRAGPPHPANDPGCRGTRRRGNDGLSYVRVPDARGVYRWKRA